MVKLLIADRLARVIERFGSESALKERFPEIAAPGELAGRSDAYYLSTITRRIFRAGLKHSLVDSKWPAFEKAFFGFDPEKMMLLSDRDFDERMQDKSLIRHWGKMSAIPVNAQMVSALSAETGGFGCFLENWPAGDIVGLWFKLAKEGKQLGGHSAPRFLRMVGKDTFLLTSDVTDALIAIGVVDKAATGKRDLLKVQEAFNDWKQATGYSLAGLSQILAYSQN